MKKQLTIGFIGGGNMATSIIGGLVNSQGDVSGENLWVFDLDKAKLKALHQEFGVNIASDNDHLIRHCDVVVFAIKPQVMKAVVQPIAQSLRNKNPLMISVVAGIEISSIEAWVESSCSIVRVMPNTPALIGTGASGLYASSNVSSDQKLFTEEMMSAVGISHWVASEQDIDSITALSGSGPAYFMLFIKSLIDSAVKNGIDPEGASSLAVQTAMGAAQMIQQSDESIQTLIDNVTSPNGTTEQAMNSFYANDLVGIVEQAFNAAKTRSEEMARELA